MAKKLLDDRFIKTLKTDEPVFRVSDEKEPGLSIRVTNAGRKSWGFDFTAPKTGKRANLTIGTYPSISLKEARDAAIALKGKVQRGIDPRLPEEVGTTVADLAESRLTLYVRPDIDPKTGNVRRKGLRSLKEVERRYRKDIIPVVGNIPIKDFTIKDLNKAVDPLIAAGKLRMAGIVYSDLQTLFNFAVGRGEVPFNPIAKAEMLGSTGNERERYLSHDEIRVVWNRLPHVMAQSEIVPQIAKLCLITGQRPGEICAMRKSEIDMARNIWTIPGDKTKNEDEHDVPLTASALEIIRDVWGETSGDIIFKKDKRKGKAKKTLEDESINEDTVSQAIRRIHERSEDSPRGKLDMEPWTPHDLRRTVSTHMSLAENKLEIPELHISHVLNHRNEKRKTVTQRVYNRNDYLTEKRAALEKWEAFLKRLVFSALPTDAA